MSKILVTGVEFAVRHARVSFLHPLFCLVSSYIFKVASLNNNKHRYLTKSQKINNYLTSGFIGERNTYLLNLDRKIIYFATSDESPRRLHTTQKLSKPYKFLRSSTCFNPVDIKGLQGKNHREKQYFLNIVWLATLLLRLQTSICSSYYYRMRCLGESLVPILINLDIYTCVSLRCLVGLGWCLYSAVYTLGGSIVCSGDTCALTCAFTRCEKGDSDGFFKHIKT